MVRLNKIYGNLMVDLKPTNAKLTKRAIRLTALATGADDANAQAMLESCDYQVKVAIVALLKKISVANAMQELADAKGSVRAALDGLSA